MIARRVPSSLTQIRILITLCVLTATISSCSKQDERKTILNNALESGLKLDSELPKGKVFDFELQKSYPGMWNVERDAQHFKRGAGRSKLEDQTLGLLKLGLPLEKAYEMARHGAVSLSLFAAGDDQVCSKEVGLGAGQIYQYVPTALNLFREPNETYNLELSKIGRKVLISSIEWFPPVHFDYSNTNITAESRAESLLGVMQSWFQPIFGKPNFIGKEFSNERKVVTRWCTRGDFTCFNNRPDQPSLSINRRANTDSVQLLDGEDSALNLGKTRNRAGCAPARASEQRLYLHFISFLTYDLSNSPEIPVFKIRRLDPNLSRLFSEIKGEFQYCKKVTRGVYCAFISGEDANHHEKYERIVLFKRQNTGRFEIAVDKDWRDIASAAARSRIID